MKRRHLLALLLVAATAWPVALAAQTAPATSAARSMMTKGAAAVRAGRAAQSAAVKNVGAAAAGGARTTSVVGYLWTANNQAITDATVQLRNTVTGQVELVTRSNALGEFAFSNVDGGSYVIEYVSDSAAGQLMALGHPFSVAPGETVATFVRMTNVVGIVLPDMASNVAASAVQTAASAGVTAVVMPIAPVREEPPPPVSSSVR